MSLSRSNCTSILDQVKIASPCTVDWDKMTGDERVRFCGQCSKNVFNLSQMSKKDAEDLIYQSEGKVCVRFYQRHDGTILTDDCPVGLKTVRAGLRRLSSLAATVCAILFGLTPAANADQTHDAPPLMGSPMPIPQESALKPWMEKYKKDAIAAVLRKIKAENNSPKLTDTSEFIVEIRKDGTSISATALKCSADQSGFLQKSINATRFPAFPKEASEGSVRLKLQIPKDGK